MSSQLSVAVAAATASTAPAPAPAHAITAAAPAHAITAATAATSMNITWHTKLDADQSATLLTQKLFNRQPFVYIRFGDADIDWMFGGTAPTCDGEYPQPCIREALHAAWNTLLPMPHFYLGDAESFSDPATDTIRANYADLINSYLEDHPDEVLERFLHTEALLLHRRSQALFEFYRTLKIDCRRKYLVGPARIQKAFGLLGLTSHFVVDPTTASLKAPAAINELSYLEWDVLLLCCGRASKLIVAGLAQRFPNRTIIELGSALDPLYVGRTRSGQLEPGDAREFLKELL